MLFELSRSLTQLWITGVPKMEIRIRSIFPGSRLTLYAGTSVSSPLTMTSLKLSSTNRLRRVWRVKGHNQQALLNSLSIETHLFAFYCNPMMARLSHLPLPLINWIFNQLVHWYCLQGIWRTTDRSMSQMLQLWALLGELQLGQKVSQLSPLPFEVYSGGWKLHQLL